MRVTSPTSSKPDFAAAHEARIVAHCLRIERLGLDGPQWSKKKQIPRRPNRKSTYVRKPSSLGPPIPKVYASTTIAQVTDELGLDLATVASRRRVRRSSRARWLVMAELRKRGYRIQEIARMFDFGHQPVIYGLRRLADESNQNLPRTTRAPARGPAKDTGGQPSRADQTPGLRRERAVKESVDHGHGRNGAAESGRREPS